MAPKRKYTGPCSVEGCNEDARTKGFCIKHYKVFHRLGTPIVSRPCFHGTAEERLWHYTNKLGPDDCWEWFGNKDKDGYGAMRSGKSMIRPHRLSYELANGPIPKGMSILHSCNNPACVNPAHLRVGDHLENMADRKKSGHYNTGDKHVMAKISDDEVKKIREMDGTYKQIAEAFGVSESQIGNIKRGDQRKAV